MPGSAFIQHTVNNDTARSDEIRKQRERERERVASKRCLMIITEREREKKNDQRGDSSFSHII